MRISFILVLYLFQSFLFAQETQNEVKPETESTGWQIGITVSPSYVIPYNASISPVRFVKYFKLEPSFGTSASVLVSKNLNGHFQIEAGIGYSECRYKSVYALGTGRVNNTNDPIYQDFIAEKRVDSRLDYFQLPIRVNYLAGKGRVKFIGSIGVSPAWVVSRINTLSEIFTKGGGTFLYTDFI